VREAGLFFGVQTFARDMLYGVRNLRRARLPVRRGIVSWLSALAPTP